MFDVYRVFEHLPDIVGLDLVRHGDKWQGGYYLNGDMHEWRKDKLKIYKWNNNIWLKEEGGDSLSLIKWLCQYGGVESVPRALEMLENRNLSISFDHKRREREVKYVGGDVLAGYKRFDLRKCALFCWMSGLFGEDRVRECWDRYNVTTNQYGDAVFWNVDEKGRILHDKVMRYLPNGHRDKSFGGYREYRSGDGYNGRCYFGAHLVGSEGEILVTESEKSALVLHLYTGEKVVATAGKSNMRDFNRRFILYPDMDAFAAWRATGNAVVEWYRDWGIDKVPEKADICDMIEWKIRNKR